MSSTSNTELRTFQRSVRDKIRELGRSLHWSGGPQVERDLGLADLHDDFPVTVTVTVPAQSQDEANRAVEAQVRYVVVPEDWSVNVG